MEARTGKDPRPIHLVDHRLNQQKYHYSERVLHYFTSESKFLLVCLTVSLLILPLVLPPLPPPPFLLLLLPICIMGFLMVLAFMPPKFRDLTNSYV